MARLIWKRLRPEDLAAFREYLDGLHPRERPVYGLLGVQVSWWTRLGGCARRFVVLFRGGRMIVSKRSWHGGRAVHRREYPVAALQRVTVRRGPLLESIRLRFEDGYSVRVGSLPRHQSEPVQRFLQEGAGAFDPASLTPEQLTNTCLACEAMGLPAATFCSPAERGSPPPAEGSSG
jgi:hypothetical protein